MFADRIRILRSERNLTQAEVAREVELSPRGYQDLAGSLRALGANIQEVP